MTRNRHKKISTKTASLDFHPPSIKYSPSAQIVIGRIASGGTEYLMQNLIRIMTDSVKLAQEPEFIDLNLDRMKASEASLRWMKKYDKRLAEAKKKGGDEFHEVFDEMRIEVINEMATPAFRKDVDKRLQAMLDRLTTSDDLEKIEMVLLLKPLLGMKSVPWGLCGLILVIFDRTMQQEIQECEDEKSVYDAVVEALKDEGEEKIDVIKMIKSPGKLEQIGQKLFGAKPGLQDRVEKQIWKMVDDFEKELAQGNIKLDLFTQEELLLSFQHLQTEIGEQSTKVQPTEEMNQRVFSAIVQAIKEMMSPERFQRMRNHVESTANTWLRERKKWGAALQGELIWLDEEQYEENKFVISAYLGQIKRLGKDQNPAQKQKKRGL